MSDNETTTAPVATKEKNVAEDMASRRIFPNAQEASEYLNGLGTTLKDFGEYPLAAPGIDSEGNFDPAIYTDDVDVMVATLRAQKGSKTYRGRAVNAIVIAPVPKIDVLLSREDGRQWVEKILHKEMNHVAVRALRDAEDVSTVIEDIPTTIVGYISTSREGGSTLLEAFNELWKPVNDILKSKVPVWNKARLIKSDFKKCCESRGFALEYYSALEDRGEGKDSLIVGALNLMISAAKKKGLDATIFERWLATRNAKTYDASQEDDDLDNLDFDDLADSLLEEQDAE